MLGKMINCKYNIFIVFQHFVSMNFITLMNTILLTWSWCLFITNISYAWSNPVYILWKLMSFDNLAKITLEFPQEQDHSYDTFTTNTNVFI